jgi:DNA-binding transcriptional LysR family regulator
VPQTCFSPGGDFVPLEDAALAAMGLRRHVAMTLPSFLSVARLVAGSHLIGMVPAPLALSLADTLNIELFDHPFSFAAVPLSLFWHVRHTHDAAHRWMREHMLRLIRPYDAVAHPVRWITAERASGAPQSKGRRRAHGRGVAPIGHSGA